MDFWQGQLFGSYVFVYFMILCRLTPVLIFKSINPLSMLPRHIKLYVTLIMSLTIFFALDDVIRVEDYVIKDNFQLVSALSVEFLIGITFWFGLLVVYGALFTLLKLMDMQVGFNPMGIFNPSMNDSDPILTRIVIIFVSLLFFINNGHYKILSFLTETLRVIPLGGGHGQVDLMLISGLMTKQFTLAIILIIPMIIAIFWVELILGLCNKMMPQLNIYFVGLPLKIAVAILVLSLTSEHTISVFERMMLGLYDYWNKLY